MIKIDGSQGEGGGQILRTALSMAMVTGQSVQIEHVRAGRAKPGLMRQHLACVAAAQAVSNAEVDGMIAGSQLVIFKPNTIRHGRYDFSVGSAASTLLIFQTVLPALAMVKGESQLTFYGGTHNAWAPSFDFIQLCFAPLMRQMGVEIDMTLERHGFYPQGGGQWTATVKSSGNLQPFELLEPGDLLSKQAVVSGSGIPAHVYTRELKSIEKSGVWSTEELMTNKVNCLGSGNIISLRLHYQMVTEVVEQVGKLGLSAEKVARNAVKAMRRYQIANVAVGKYLADQLLLPMALADGGVFRTLEPSLHCRTNCDVIQQFVERRFVFSELAKDRWEIRYGSR